jgi:Sulfotransferase family
VDDCDELLRTARERTGLSDFGDDSFREGLERLVRSLRTEATLNAVGAVALPELILKHLSQRLQIESWYTRHPEIDDVPISSPLIGLGLPRTGSTALSILLAEDPNARSLRRWEASAPCPPPSTVRGPDPRIAQAETEQALADELAPRLRALVPTSATGPEECQDLMALDFRAHYFQAFAYVPAYSDWLLDADLSTTYRYERRTLKLLQWGEPARPWRLKCPSHLLWLDDLDDAFPDARFVMTHRDPSEVMVSVADVYQEVGNQFSADVDPHYLGELNVRDWTKAMNRVVEFRRVHGDDRFFDIDFREFQRDPLTQVRALYSWLGEPVSERFEEGMRTWWADHAADREPNIHPDPRQFGLDVDELRVVFGPYTEMMRAWTARGGDGIPGSTA